MSRYQVCCLTPSGRGVILGDICCFFIDFRWFGTPKSRISLICCSWKSMENEEKSSKNQRFSSKISIFETHTAFTLLGVSEQSWYVDTSTPRACYINNIEKNHTVSGRASRLAADRLFRVFSTLPTLLY